MSGDDPATSAISESPNCPACGYALEGLPPDALCPECGSSEREYRVVLTREVGEVDSEARARLLVASLRGEGIAANCTGAGGLIGAWRWRVLVHQGDAQRAAEIVRELSDPGPGASPEMLREARRGVLVGLSVIGVASMIFALAMAGAEGMAFGACGLLVGGLGARVRWRLWVILLGGTIGAAMLVVELQGGLIFSPTGHELAKGGEWAGGGVLAGSAARRLAAAILCRFEERRRDPGA